MEKLIKSNNGQWVLEKAAPKLDVGGSVFTMDHVKQVMDTKDHGKAKEMAHAIVDESNAKPMTKKNIKDRINNSKNVRDLGFLMSNHALAHPSEGLKVIKEEDGLEKAAPKGVDKEKWDRCVDKVKAKGGVESPHAVCTSAMTKDEDKKTPSDPEPEFGVTVDKAPFVPKGKLMEGAERKSQVQDDLSPSSFIQATSQDPKKVNVKGHKMSQSYTQTVNQKRDEDLLKPRSGQQEKIDAKAAAAGLRTGDAKNMKELEMIRAAKDRARRVLSAEKNAKYYSKDKPESKIVRRSKEDMVKTLDSMIFDLNKAIEGDYDSKMLFSQLEAIVHHVQEIRETFNPKENAPDWVNAKITEATKNLSDVAHYIMGEKVQD